jgi:hypothetical protein
MVQDFQYGAYEIQIGFRDSSGYVMGTQTSPDSVAQGTTTSLYRLPSLVSFQPAKPSYEIATNRGGQKILNQASMGISDLGTAQLVLSEHDTTFHAYVSGSSIESTTPSGWYQGGTNVNKSVLPSLFMVVSAQVNTRTGTGGTTSRRWKHWILPNVQIRPTYPETTQGGGVNPNPLTYELVPSTSTRTLSGYLLSSTTMALDDDSDSMLFINSANRISATTYVEAASPAGTFILGYRPLTNQATTSDKTMTKNGATASITTLSATTGVVTMTPGSAGDKFVLVYETNFVAI